MANAPFREDAFDPSALWRDADGLCEFAATPPRRAFREGDDANDPPICVEYGRAGIAFAGAARRISRYEPHEHMRQGLSQKEPHRREPAYGVRGFFVTKAEARHNE